MKAYWKTRTKLLPSKAFRDFYATRACLGDLRGTCALGGNRTYIKSLGRFCSIHWTTRAYFRVCAYLFLPYAYNGFKHLQWARGTNLLIRHRTLSTILPYCSFGGILKYAILIFMSDNLTNEEKLDRMLKLTEENNKMLRSMHRSQTVSNIFRLLYWTLIIASIAGAYYFIKPMLTSFSGDRKSVV